MSQTLPYETVAASEPRPPRPLWVYAVVGVYALILLGLSLLPLISMSQGDSAGPVLIATVTVLAACEVALLFVPVRVASRRPITRRALWVPLLASGVLAALLGVGATLALVDYFRGDVTHPWVIPATATAVWFVWSFVFWSMSQTAGPDAVAAKLHRWLLAGSALELLIAVPTHVIVRRRGDCCAGIGTGLGICAGVVVMLLAFGPSVGFLYYRRWKQIRGK